MNEQVSKTSLALNKRRYLIGISRFIFFTTIAVLIFFIPFQINGNTEILFGYIYNFLIEFFGIVGIWIISVLILGNAVLGFTGKFISKEGSRLHNFYKKDSKMYIPIYFLGALYSTLYTLQVSIPAFNGPAAIVGPGTGELMSGIALAVMWVIPLGAIFIPFFVNYGSIDFVGTLLQPIMRPIFKVPGKSAIDAITSFLTSSSVAVLFTTKLYNMKYYTKKEAAVITTSFSAVSIGFAAVVIDTAGLMDHFSKVYFSSFLVAFIIAFIMIRIPPLSLKKNVYIDGSEQEAEARSTETYSRNTLGIAFGSAIDQAADSNEFFSEIKKSLMEGLAVLPKVLSMLFAIGVSVLILAEYTPTFEIIGSVIAPFIQLLNVPDAALIAPSLALGLAEMFLPVLYIADMVGTLDIQARYFVTAVSMVQIIFFAETGAVMLSTGLPLKLWELIVIFTLRTLIAMPLVAIFMHLLF
ncbi:YjiH family protein [Salinicoccus roseus]|uniref:Nucleoside recognition domain-containing protein n=1 Tax=Salinicoccus roseus TaxID=45670 RepID=A0A0C2HM72_9STAP|nr:nucleoside recognition domain-containing protein [Salinicoccus roseus]KIH70671.1 transporter [Salinicoccus roseus]MDB0580779.1 nucleoside recognition domain-containing protein [Salinicoccus roseus]